MGYVKKGCLHIYCGDGKGKTTASVGLAVRAAGYGLKVLFCQCMKDGRALTGWWPAAAATSGFRTM